MQNILIRGFQLFSSLIFPYFNITLTVIITSWEVIILNYENISSSYLNCLISNFAEDARKKVFRSSRLRVTPDDTADLVKVGIKQFRKNCQYLN